MNQILNKVRDVDPNNSDAVKDALSPFFQNLSKHTDADCNRWLRTLETVINRFPKYCMSSRGTIESYVSHLLSSNNVFNVIEAAKCAHILQQVRPTQEKTATPKSCWRDQMDALCNAAHALIGVVFPQAVDIYQQNGKSQKNQVPPNSPLAMALSRIASTGKCSDKQALLTTRLKNVFIFIQAMLVEVYPVAKPIRPQTVLDVIVRALSVSSGTNTATSINLSSVTMVKSEALRSLDALVSCLGPNLIPFSPLVFKCVMQTLKWSSDNPSDEARKVRCSAYNSLERWLGILRVHHTGSSNRSWEDELTAHLVDDVTPPRRVMQLTASAQPTKNLSKKAKRKLANSMLQDSSISSHMPNERNKVHISEEVNDDVAIAALECAETFLTVCGIFLNPATHKRFQELLVRESFNIEAYSLPRALPLLRVLEASRKSTPPQVPPPTQYCLQLYSVFINSKHREISNFCSQALLDIRLHLHCSPPSINFAIETQPDRTEDKKQKMSERNRAALESLLGADKAKQYTEVITIPDEPSSKKPRLEEADKISLSSASVHSVEVSDESDEENDVLEVEVDVEEENDESNKAVIEEIRIEEIDATNNEEIPVDEIDANAMQVEEDSKEAETDPVEINDAVTQIADKNVKLKMYEPNKKVNIFEAATQIPLNTTSDDIADEEDRPLSMEVAYDYPNTGKETLTVLEKLDDENLPSTNDTDDIQITCGQIVKNSQDVDPERKSEEVKLNVEPKVNGVDKSPEKVVQNGDVSESDNDKIGSVTAKVATNDVNVEDMLADFVDEVVEDNMQG